MRNIEVSGLRFRPNKDFTIRSLLDRAWLSRAMRRWEREDEISEIRVTAAQAARLAEDWYYRHAVFTPAEDGRIAISIPTTSRDRLYPLIRWLGPGAELISPASLRPDLARQLSQMAQAHADEAASQPTR